MTTDKPTEEVLQRETLLEFPCKFPVKAMGLDQDDFESLVSGLVLEHACLYAGEGVSTNLSSSGKYLSVTVTIEAHSKDQLDTIYRALTDCERVLMAL